MRRLTQKQYLLARHALGLPNDHKKSYRNHFMAADGTPDFNEWKTMEADGFAFGVKCEELWGKNNTMFRLSESGARRALFGREKLDEEDFPRYPSEEKSVD